MGIYGWGDVMEQGFQTTYEELKLGFIAIGDLSFTEFSDYL